MRSGKHYELSLSEEPSAPTKDRLFGDVVHTILLEPEQFDQRVAVLPDFESQMRFHSDRPTATNEYKGLAANWEKLHAGKIWITADRHQEAAQCAINLAGAIGTDVRDGADTEVCVVSYCPLTDLRCKCRLDLWPADREIIVDVKTTRDLDNFEREIAKWQYHRQGAFYQRIVAPHVGGRLLPYWIAAVETEKPYMALFAPLSEAALEEGRRLVGRAMHRIERGVQTGKWTGYRRRLQWHVPSEGRVVDMLHHGKLVTIGGYNG